MKKIKALVTGGSGFLGSHMVDLLLGLGYDVTIFDSKPPKLESAAGFIKGDITDLKAVTQAVKGCDFAFHFAGMLGTHELMRHVEEAMKVNTIGPVNIAQACIENNCKLVFISKLHLWRNIYTITKVCAENMIAAMQYHKGLQAVTVKFTTVFGERQPLESETHYRKAIPTWIESSLRGKPLEVFGTGNHRMHLICAEDAVKAVMSVVGMGAWQDIFMYTAFLIGSNVTMKSIEVARMIKNECGSSSKIVHKPMPDGEGVKGVMYKPLSYPYQIKITYPSRERFKSNIEKTIAWYRNYLGLG